MSWQVHRIYGYHRPESVEQYLDEQDARLGYARTVAERHIRRIPKSRRHG